MKIAIKANPNRGKEIISLLKSLGGNNTSWDGDGTTGTYYIDENNMIRYGDAPKDYKVYTLEEFEKEFPFKVGDKVIHKEFNDFFEVISFNPGLSYPYKIKGVCEFSTKSYVLTKWQPKMKEERFVTLTLDKAREWYKKGGELKEVALQAFSEKELTKIKLPKTWKEFCDNYPVQEEYWLGSFDQILRNDYEEERTFRNWIPSKKSAEAHLALIQLEQLRDCWRQGWKPTKHDTGYRITRYPEECSIMSFNFIDFLSFPTKEMAEEFLKCFKDLIETAGDLI